MDSGVWNASLKIAWLLQGDVPHICSQHASKQPGLHCTFNELRNLKLPETIPRPRICCSLFRCLPEILISMRHKTLWQRPDDISSCRLNFDHDASKTEPKGGELYPLTMKHG
jgi:hypothetical protein